MMGWIIAITVVAALVGYICVGVRAAKRYAGLFWEQAREMWGYDSIARGDVHAKAAAMVAFWPVMWPYLGFARSIDRLDPQEIKRREVEMQQRIKELEAELGMGK